MRFVVALAFVAFAIRRLLTYLHIYQQEEYDSRRFLRWLVKSAAFDRKATIAIAVIAGLQAVIVLSDFVAGLLAAISFLTFFAIEKDPRRAAKKKLVMTGRAKRIYVCGLGILAILAFSVNTPVWGWIFWIQLIPVALVFANVLTLPHENRIQKRFWSEAHGKLQSLKPTIIGITGSYGKTSTKHLLGHILEMQAPTLITPGSVNTPMGIARVVREQLGSHHRFFVCEMGAYGPGSIARLCRLAPPDLGVITAIGMAHYERFKTLATVASTKFELAEAVVSKRGKVIVAEQVLEQGPAREFVERNGGSTIVAGRSSGAGARILSSAQTESGIEAELRWNGASYRLRAPIYGEHHISNMVLAFVAACTLGVSAEDAVLALASVPQIRHRLEVKTGPAGARLIDDAYNSNPAGFRSGLQLMSALNQNGGRRILVTPGMVELGGAHDEEHRKIGELAGQQTDVLLAVVPERIQALTAGFASANPNGTILRFSDYASAQKWLDANVRAEDVVLLENDLPDVYEKKLRL